MDTARLASRLGPWQERLVADERLPCAQVAVVRHGRVQYRAMAGMQNPGTPLRQDTIFRIYSMTKPIVSVALMMLYEEGKFQLNDPVKLWLGPKWGRKRMRVFVRGGTPDAYETVPCETSIRVWHLLTHTSGLSYGFDEHGQANPVDVLYHRSGVVKQRRGAALTEFVDALAALPLVFQPGQHWHYGYNTDVVGRLVECISGQPLDEFLRARVFAPLGMYDTGFDVPPAKRGRFATLHMPRGGMASMGPGRAGGPRTKGLLDIDASATKGYRTRAELGGTKMLSGGGGLVSTLADYTKFCQMLLRGGQGPDHTRLLSRKTLQYMATNHLPGGKDMAELSLEGYSELPEPGIGFGLGFSVVLDPAKTKQICSKGTFAWGGAASTIFWVDPEEDLAVVFMTQLMFNDRLRLPLRATLQSIVYGAVCSTAGEGDGDGDADGVGGGGGAVHGQRPRL